jgi:hypothetical protein
MTAEIPIKLRGSLILVVIVTLLGLVCVELAFRAMQGIPVTSTENFLVSYLDLIRANGGAIQYDPTLGWRLRDNFQTTEFTIGAYGLRMNDNRLRPPPNGAILAVGDSFTAGSGVSDSETWPAQLERTVGMPTLNAAAGAWGVDQMVLRVEELTPALKPSVVIVGILAQDSLRNAFRIYGGGHKPLFVPRNGSLELTNVPTPRVDAQPMEVGLVRRTLGHSYVVHWTMLRLGLASSWADDRMRYEQAHSNETGVQISCLLMDRLARLKESAGARVIVMVQYSAPEAEGAAPWYAPPVLACASKRGLEAVDSYPSLHALAKMDRARFVELWLNEGGQLGHMSAKGNAFIADLLAKQILTPASDSSNSEPQSVKAN